MGSPSNMSLRWNMFIRDAYILEMSWSILESKQLFPHLENKVKSGGKNRIEGEG